MIELNRKFDDFAKNHFKEIKPDVLIKLNKSKIAKNIKLLLASELENIITLKPDQLHAKYISPSPETELSKYLNNARNKKKIGSVFDYSWFSGTYKTTMWCAYKMVEQLNINVCPYCNRQYVFTIPPVKDPVTKKISKKTRPTLDHYFPQKNYPYLALSYYNLIPSCYICNSNMKGDANIDFSKIMHPYTDSYRKIMKFTIDILSPEINSIKDFDIDLKYDNSFPADKISKAKNTIELFGIKEIYSNHKHEALGIIKKRMIYNDSYIDSISALTELKKLFPTKKDVLNSIFLNSLDTTDESIILSKFIGDIIDDYDKKTIPSQSVDLNKIKRY